VRPVPASDAQRAAWRSSWWPSARAGAARSSTAAGATRTRRRSASSSRWPRTARASAWLRRSAAIQCTARSCRTNDDSGSVGVWGSRASQNPHARALRYPTDGGSHRVSRRRFFQTWLSEKVLFVGRHVGGASDSGAGGGHVLVTGTIPRFRDLRVPAVFCFRQQVDASVDKTGERNMASRTAFGGADRRVQGSRTSIKNGGFAVPRKEMSWKRPVV
jgi:hypothetical protein